MTTSCEVATLSWCLGNICDVAKASRQRYVGPVRKRSVPVASSRPTIQTSNQWDLENATRYWQRHEVLAKAWENNGAIRLNRRRINDEPTLFDAVQSLSRRFLLNALAGMPHKHHDKTRHYSSENGRSAISAQKFFAVWLVANMWLEIQEHSLREFVAVPETMWTKDTLYYAYEIKHSYREHNFTTILLISAYYWNVSIESSTFNNELHQFVRDHNIGKSFYDKLNPND